MSGGFFSWRVSTQRSPSDALRGCMQAHGQRTQYAFMLDADFEVRNGWRLRLAVQRLSRECARRSVAQCLKGLMVRGCLYWTPPCNLCHLFQSLRWS